MAAPAEILSLRHHGFATARFASHGNYLPRVRDRASVEIKLLTTAQHASSVTAA
jgi:hypothetical protein